MPLVYLDTSHLSRLARTRRDMPERFVEFAAVWHSRRCVLALSRVHLTEALYHADAEVWGDRVAMVAELRPIVTDIAVQEPPPSWGALLIDREIVRGLIERGVIGLGGSDLDSWIRWHATIFPMRLDTAEAVGLLNVFAHASFRAILALERSAQMSSAEAEARPADTSYQRTRISDFSDVVVPPEHIEESIRQLEAAMCSEANIGRLLPLMSRDEAVASLDGQAETMRQMLRRAGEVGPRQAFVEALGLVAVPDGRNYTDDVMQDVLFRDAVRRVARESLSRTDSESIAFLQERLSLRDCPGAWLSRAVQLRMRLAESRPAASNAHDLGHVAYYPYVDAFYTDRRVANYLNQVLRDADNLELIGARSQPVSVPDTIDAIQASLPSAG